MNLFCFLLVCCLCFSKLSFSQEQQASGQEALALYLAISDSIAASFPEDEMRTFRRNSFSEIQLQTYLSRHFKRMDLLPQIEGNHTLKLNSYLHSGNWFHEIGFPSEAIKAYKDFFALYEECEPQLIIPEIQYYIEMRNYAYNIMAENYAKLSYFDSTAITLKKNIKFTKDYTDIFYPSSLNNYGLYLYWHKNKLDSAQYYFKKAYYATVINCPGHTLIGSIRDNIADVYTDQQEYDKALPLHKANTSFYDNVENELTHQKDIPRLISAYVQLVKTYINLGRIDEAEQAFSGLVKIISDTKGDDSVGASSQLEFLQTKEILYQAQNNIVDAYNTSKIIKKYSDSLQNKAKLADEEWQKELNNIALDRVALNFKIERIQKENKIFNQRLLLWIMLLVSLILIGVFFVLLSRRRQLLLNAENKSLLAEQDLQLEQLRNEQLQTEVVSKERDLSDFAINLSHSHEWAKLLYSKLTDLKETKGRKRSQLMDDLEKEIKTKVVINAESKEFFERLDRLSDSFYSQLNDKYPQLSKTDKRLCSLIRLKMNSHQIAAVQNISLASLNTSRYRLRKKLMLEEDVSLDSFIQSL